MAFIDNFERYCKARGEAPSHALTTCGISKSALTKWRAYPDRTPSGTTIKRIADYFGCTFEDLLYSGPVKDRTNTAIAIQALVDKMQPDQQEYLLRMIRFIWGETK